LTIVKNFLNEIEEAFESLKENPFYQMKKDTYRSFPLKKFPFILFFEIVRESDNVKILAVFHTSRSPANWP
jgi:plasmid stabilization system protein ParE